MRQARPFALSAFVLLFLVQSLRTLYAAVPVRAAAGDVLSIVLAALLLLLAALPLSRLMGRAPAVALAAAVAALARLATVLPVGAARAPLASLAVAGGLLFLGLAVGQFEQREVVAALPTALVVDEIARVAAPDPLLYRAGSWVAVQLALTLATLLLAAWVARRSKDAGGVGLERRAGGLRLRGGTAVGCLLYLDLALVGSPERVAGWTGIPYPAAAFFLIATGAAAVLAVLLLPDPPPVRRSGALAFALAAGVVPALAAAWPWLGRAGGGWGFAGILALAHAGVLLLCTWVLAPAGGRRGEWTALPGIAVLVLLAFLGGAPATGVAAALVGAVVLTAALLLLPRPPLSEPLGAWPRGGLALLVLLLHAAPIF